MISVWALLQIFKMWNKELYVREQQDAYEFFTSLVDQLDEHLKVHTHTHTLPQPPTLFVHTPSEQLIGFSSLRPLSICIQ